MEGRHPLLVPLVDLRAQVEEVVDHVQLAVRRREVQRRARPVVLRDEVGVDSHHLGQHLGVTQPGAAAGRVGI